MSRYRIDEAIAHISGIVLRRFVDRAPFPPPPPEGRR